MSGRVARFETSDDTVFKQGIYIYKKDRGTVTVAKRRGVVVDDEYLT